MANKKITPGIYTFKELLEKAGVDYQKAVTVEDANGSRVDNRRVVVGGLSFDDPNQTLVVPKFDGDEFLPEGHTPLEIRVDSKLEGKLEVDGEKDFRPASELADDALLPHVDPDKPGLTQNAQKSELTF